MKTQISRSTNKTTAIVIMIVLAAVLWNSQASGVSPDDAGARKRDRYLLLDSRIVDTTENAKLTLGTVKKDQRNPLFMEDKPWEPRYDNVYANVIYDENGKLASEFTDNAKSGQLVHGAIGLQIHDKGMQVEFKDIRLKQLGNQR